MSARPVGSSIKLPPIILNGRCLDVAASKRLQKSGKVGRRGSASLWPKEGAAPAINFGFDTEGPAGGGVHSLAERVGAASRVSSLPAGY